MTGEATAEHIEQQLELVLGVGAVDHGEGAGTQGGGDLSAIVAGTAATLDDDGGRGHREAGEQVEEGDAGLVAGLA